MDDLLELAESNDIFSEHADILAEAQTRSRRVRTLIWGTFWTQKHPEHLQKHQTLR